MSRNIPTANPQPISTGQAVLSDFGKSRTQNIPLGQQFFQCLCAAALGLASYFFVSHFFLQSVEVVGVSMTPTLHHSERYLLNRWLYHIRAPQRFDVVVIRDPVDESFSVKRIVAMAGDWVYLKDGKVYVNGHQLKEPYLAPGTPTFPDGRLREQSFHCGKDEYLVLGDNRTNSADSRMYGLISRRNVLGLILR